MGYRARMAVQRAPLKIESTTAQDPKSQAQEQPRDAKDKYTVTFRLSRPLTEQEQHIVEYREVKIPLGLDTDRQRFAALYAYNTTIEEVVEAADAIKAAIAEVEAAGLAAEQAAQVKQDQLNAERAVERKRRDGIAESIDWS